MEWERIREEKRKRNKKAKRRERDRWIDTDKANERKTKQ